MDDKGDRHIPGFNGDGLAPLMNNDNHRRRASVNAVVNCKTLFQFEVGK